MAQPDPACCEAGVPKPSNYNPKGQIINLGDLPLYQVGTGKKAIILCYDIFGWNEISKNVYTVADDIAGLTGYTVVMPDFYRGDPWPIGNFPPTSELEKRAFSAWKDGVASDIVCRKDVYERVLPHLYSKKLTDIGVIGLCWGGKQSFLFGADSERFKAVASVHGAWIDAELTSALEVPLYYAPAKGDTHVNIVRNALTKKKFAKQCVFKYFGNQQHGFCAARGDWSDRKVKKDVDLMLTQASKFFQATLK